LWRNLSEIQLFIKKLRHADFKSDYNALKECMDWQTLMIQTTFAETNFEQVKNLYYTESVDRAGMECYPASLISGIVSSGKVEKEDK
jgi:hypothetical protein